jgi:tetratricopeptide (TPR) repeat protein
LCGWSADDADVCCGARDQLASLDEITLLILDNCDDPRTNFSRYIPNSPRISVILTTRLFDAGKYATPDLQHYSRKHFLRLTGLDEESAVALVLEASEVQECDVKSDQQARHIAEVLDYHPLALVVASSLIQSTTYSLEEYAEALASQFTRSELLKTESEQATYRKVSATFEVSADTLVRLATTDPSAHNALVLLEILGFFHRQDVSEDIFVRAWDCAEEVSSHSVDKDWPSEDLTSWHVTQSQYLAVSGTSEEKKRAFRRCRAHLIKLSLVSVDITGYVISLHSLVHTWARERAPHPVEAWTAAASILSLSAMDRRSWQAFTPTLVKHMEACSTSSNASTPSSLEVCKIWYAFAWQMDFARSPGAMELLQYVTTELSDREDGEGLLVNSQRLLGRIYTDEGQVRRAIELLEHVVSVHEKLSDDHHDRVASQRELAKAYEANNQIPRAIEILEHVVKVEEKLADEHPNRLSSQHALAGAYSNNGQISRAIEILEHVVRIEEKRADEHPNRLSYQHALANAYTEDGQISRAIEILEHVVKVEEKLADDHHDRLSSQHALANAYTEDGQISRAIEILEHVVKVQEKLAYDHPSRITPQHNLAIAYWESGRKIEAECIFRHVVAIQQKSLRADHPKLLNSERWLAKIVRHKTRASKPPPDTPAGAEQTPKESSSTRIPDNVVDRCAEIPRKSLMPGSWREP